MQAISDAYILGIKDGRAFLNAFPGLTLAEKTACLENCKRQLKRGFAQPMRDLFKGERDFWINQIKKG